MTNPQPQPSVLSHETLKLVELREAHKSYHDPDYKFVPVYEDERDALCATVRAAWAQIETLIEAHRIDRNELQKTNNALREQLAEAHRWIDRKNVAIETWQQQAKEYATRLAQVEQERDRYKRLYEL